MGQIVRGEGMYVPVLRAWAMNPASTHAKPASAFLIHAVQSDSTLIPNGVEVVIPGMYERLHLSTAEARTLIKALKRAVKQADGDEPIRPGYPEEWGE